MDTVVDRLIRYAKVYSESDYHAGRTVTPSTDRQFDMAKLLVEELHGLGIENARYDDKCYVYATLDATPGCEQLPAIGLIAHMDINAARMPTVLPICWYGVTRVVDR